MAMNKRLYTSTIIVYVTAIFQRHSVSFLTYCFYHIRIPPRFYEDEDKPSGSSYNAKTYPKFDNILKWLHKNMRNRHIKYTKRAKVRAKKTSG